jgi:drug/metabolite transporter (DMT)-like permease
MKNQDHTKLPTGRDIPFLILGVLGIGSSGPIIAKATMPIPTMIFWRNLVGALVMMPFAIARGEWRTKAQQSAIRWSILAGALLATHFVCFFLGDEINKCGYWNSVDCHPTNICCNIY